MAGLKRSGEFERKVRSLFGVGDGVALLALLDSISRQGDPTVLSSSGETMTVVQLRSRHMLAADAAGNKNMVLPTGTLMDAGLPSFGVNDAFDWSIENLSATLANTVTVTDGTGHALDSVANGVIDSSHADANGSNVGQFRSRKTAAATWETYRIA